MTSVWGDLPEQGWLAVVADKDCEDGSKIEIVGFKTEEEAYNFCTQYDSACYEWAVITGCVCSSGSRWSNGRERYL